MSDDDQPTQSLTGCELDDIEGRWSRYVALRDPDSMETSVRDVPVLLDEVDRLRSALTALGRNERAAANRSLELQEENERLRLEVVQMESGAQIAMDAGVVALQEVKRLENVCADLKLINDRMAEDRLRLVDERDRLITERDDLASRLDVREVIDQTIGELQTELEQLRAETTGTALGHLAKIERLQSQRDALVHKLGLDWEPDEFGDLDAN